MDKVSWADRTLPELLAGYVGEFIFTNLTSSITVHENFLSCNVYPTPINPYLSWIFYYIPRVFFESKPYSVAMNFSSYMDVGMGFALTPITESFCALGNWGPYFMPFIYFSAFYIILKLSYRYVFLYLILLSMVMDINRGEFSYFMNNFIFMTFCWICLLKIFNIAISKSRGGYE